VIRQDQVARRRRLVQELGEADLERGVPHRLGEAEPRGSGVRRVRAVHQQDAHRATAHRVDELSQGRVARPGGGIDGGAKSHCAPDVTRNVVEHVGGRGCDVRTVVLRTDPTCQRNAQRRGELPGQPLQRLDGHPAPVRHPLGRVRVEQGPQLLHVGGRNRQAIPYDDMRHCERDKRLRARHRRDPLVRAHRGHAHAGLDVHVPPHAPVAERMTVGERRGVLRGADPGLEEVGAEGKHVARRGEVVARQRVQPEYGPVGVAQRLVAERLVHHMVGRADRAEPLAHERAERARRVPGEEPDLIAGHAGQASGQLLHGVVPRDGIEAAAWVPRHRLPDPVGIVEPLERRLPPRAEAAAVHGMAGVAFDLDRAPLAHAHVHPAPRRTLAAGGGVPRSHAGDVILRGDQIRDQLLGAVGRAPGQRRGAAPGHAEDLQEAAAVDVVTHMNSAGRSCRSCRLCRLFLNRTQKRQKRQERQRCVRTFATSS
jgi:hypothetical protein